MRRFAAAYLVPQLPRLVVFPLVAPGFSARFDLPLWLVIAVGLPAMLATFAVLMVCVKWLREMLVGFDGDS